MTFRHESLDELDAKGIEVQLTVGQAKRLAGSQLVEVREVDGQNYKLVPNGRVGAVRFQDVQIEVRPKEKLGIEHLMFLLGYAKDPGFRPDFVVAEAHSDLWSAMAHSLIASINGALSAGVLQGYQTEQNAQLTIRGRIAFDDQLRQRPGFAFPIEVRYDEFSPDIAENQILLAALHLMLRVPRLPQDLKGRLLHLSARFTGVTRLPLTAALPHWQPTRLNDRYKHALRLAEVLLGNSSTRANDANLEMSAFVVVMWKVFEDFVTTALTHAFANSSGYPRAQVPAYLTGGGSWKKPNSARSHDTSISDVAMSLDVVHFDARNVPDAIFDAKYKLASQTGEYANSDHYQMLAYCTALQVPTAWLIYAGGGTEIRRKVKNTEFEIVAAPLNLRQPPADILSRVRQIALSALNDARSLQAVDNV